MLTPRLTQVQTGLDTIRLYEGKTALVGGTSTLKTAVQGLLNDASMGAVFSRIVTGANAAVAAEGMSFKAWMNALAMFLGVDEVLAGDSGIWDSSDTALRLGLLKVDAEGDELSHKWKPVLGKTFQFMPDGQNPWVIQTVADRVNVRNPAT